MANIQNRRSFLKNCVSGMIGVGATSQDSFRTKELSKKDDAIEIREYRTLGRTGFKVSDISTGGPGDEGILGALLDAGVNYIDTAEIYGYGRSERIVGNVLRNRDRKSVFITTKLLLYQRASRQVTKEEATKEGILKRFYKCLERVQSDYIDCLMIHAAPSVDIVKHEPFHEAVRQLKMEGRLKHAGISHHGTFNPSDDYEGAMGKVLIAAAEDGRFDVMLLAYNYLKQDMSEEVLNVCKEKNIGATLMKTNPVGDFHQYRQSMERLEQENKRIPERLQKRFARFKDKADQAESFLMKYNLTNPNDIRDAAIKFCLTNPNVDSICINFQNFDDVASCINLSGSRLAPLDKTALAVYACGYGQFYCRHSCGACESKCPQNVPVNTIMRYNHYYTAQGREKFAMEQYARMDTKKADICMNCSGFCESECPYKVPIQQLLILAHQNLILP